MTKADPMRALLLPLLLVASACSAQVADGPTPAATQPVAHSVSGLLVIPLTVTTPNGRRHALKVEVARTDPEQAQGLMFRTAMGADEGMLFPYDPPREVSFWMKNTVLSLDLIFIGPDHRVINIAANATPYSETNIPSDAPAAAVLELNAGRAAALGIVPGSRVDW